ncbi:helix-turn-helix transcriptional regulator [Amycolatopsis sp. YIM 10]|uniref:helix-turn-helix transcriptional regulator n=1 Tax=Amycolatopsis sp. YIM 10 TaxID=2653857 RepID=UPI0012904AD7|nr:helix-turn-helix transcriptional regulator [Amycolatopsis sp. YIM 10]QFU89313.1 Putative HTH-type transcriptional regulator [Amycolatopsis sp. YIM 10]
MSLVGDVVPAAGEALTARELGSALSHRIGLLVPHDGHILVGLDPVTGAGCLIDRRHCYSPDLRHRLEVEDNREQMISRLFTGPRRVEVVGSGFTDESRHAHLHENMRGEGFGGELRLALRHRGVASGWLVLLRERGSRPFSAADAVHAERLAGHLTAAMRRYVSAKPLRAGTSSLPPGVVILDRHNRIADATAAGRGWLGVLTEDFSLTEAEQSNTLLNITLLARRPGGPALSRLPTRAGWVAMSAEPLGDGPDGSVAVTVQAAPTHLLLPAVCGWYGVTPSERSVIELALRGFGAKHIARRLELSSHTVHDHFKAIYRKTGVTGRDELVAGLSA